MNNGQVMQYVKDGGNCRWVALPRIGTPERRLFGWCAMQQHVVAVGGIGVENRDASCGVEQLLYSKQQWQPFADMKRPRIWPGAVEWQGKVVVIGGFVLENGLPVNLKSTEVYDPETAC